MINKQKYIKLWDNDKDRRNRACQLLEIHDNQWRGQLKDKIRKTFASQNVGKMLAKMDISLNMLRWASDTLAPIYSDGVVRSIEGEDSESFAPYENRSLTNMTFDRAARLLFSVREVLIRPILDEDSGMFFFDVITPDICSVIRHPDNPVRLIGLVYKTADDKFVVWEEDDHRVYGPGWDEQFREGGVSYSNDYGLIPFVLCHAVFPERGTWHEGDAEGLRSATLNLGLAKTDYNHKRHLQSHKQIVITGASSKGIGKQAASDPSWAIVLKDQGANASVLDLQGDLGGHLDSIIQDAAQTLSLYGINPSAVRGNMDASSGYALSIKMTDTERVWQQQRQLWQVYEQMLYDITVAIAETDGGSPMPDGKLIFKWPDIGPKQDENEKADYWAKLLAAGVTSVPEVRRHLFNETDAGLQEFMEESEEYNQRMSPIAPPVMENPFDAGQSIIDEEIEA